MDDVRAHEEVKLDRLHSGQPVCDVQGKQIGTLAHVYRHETSDTPGATGTTSDNLVEVKTGFLGLGKHLYVPATAIEAVTDDYVIIDRPREEIEAQDWSTKPDNLTQIA